MKFLTLIAAIGAVLALATSATAAKQPAPTTCTVSGSSVTSTGLPSGTVLNFVYLDAGGHYLGGYVIGFVDGGSTVSDNTVNRPSGAIAFYGVSGETSGNARDPKFTLYSECAA